MAILIIGGTGMLQGTALGLVADGEEVFIISRTAERFRTLHQAAGNLAPHLHWLGADYTDPAGFRAAVASAVAAGPPRAVLAWMRDGPAWDILISLLNAAWGAAGWDLFRVRGSLASRESLPAAPAGVRFHLIILGFVLTESASRWLSHAEIGDGVLAAIRQNARRSIIGTVDPWDRRPRY
jgi:hypothetical protein